MRLIQCHIENFGKLSDWDYEFHEGCNIICEENGWGKSTIAAFIRVMLFGFANESKRKESENERKRFRPWQGGVYGGSLTFEHEGKRYVIQRVFGEKEKDDICELRDADTNLKIEADVTRLGEDIFQIDMESFCRSVCITQMNADITNAKTTGSMNAKLGNLVEDTDDVNQFDHVNQVLTDWLNRMSPTRKTGQIRKQKDWLAEQKQELKQKQNVETALQEYQKKREQEVRERARIAQELQENSDKQRQLVLQEKQKRYRELTETYQRHFCEYQKQRQWFPEDLPERETLRNMIELAGTQTAVQAARDSYICTEEEQRALSRYSSQFAEGVPLEKEQYEVRQKILRWQEQEENAVAQQMSGKETERIKIYQKRFQQQCPTKEEIEARIEQWNLRTQKEAAYSTKEASFQIAQMAQKQNAQCQTAQKHTGQAGGSWVVLTVMGVLLALMGIALLYWKQMFFAIPVILMGIVLIVFAILAGKKGKTQGVEVSVYQEADSNDALRKLKQELERDRDMITRTEQEIRGFLETYGLSYDAYTVSNELHQLKADVQEYDALREQERRYQEAVRADEQKRIQIEIQEFLGKYYVGEKIEAQEYKVLLKQLETDVREYLRLKERQIQYQNYNQKLWEQKQTIKAYIREFGMEPRENLQAQLLEMQEHLQYCMEKEDQLKSAKEGKERYEQNPETAELLTKPKVQVSETTDELHERQAVLTSRLEELQKNIHTYDMQLEEYGTRLDALGEQELMLAEQQENYDADMRKYHCIQATQKYLIQAKEALTARYMQPLLNGFQKYYEMLTGASAARYRLDANAKLTLEELGLQREPELLSTGYRDLLGLCMRMAFVDAMYPQQKPFILLDDPFVNYDTRNVQGGLEFLDRVSKEYQVIYFTCHDSRTGEMRDKSSKIRKTNYSIAE